jgi:two-component system, sensor histidine kinase YesM
MKLKVFKEKSNSIFYRFFIVVFLISLTSIATLSLFTYQIASDTIKKKVVNHNQYVVSSIHAKLESYMQQLESITYIVFNEDNEENLLSLYNLKDTHSWEYIDIKNRFFRSFNIGSTYVRFNNEINRIFLIKPDGSFIAPSYGVISDGYDFSSSEIFVKAIEKNGLAHFTIGNENYSEYKEEEPALIISRKIRIVGEGKIDYGVLVISVKWKNIERLIQNIVSNQISRFYILDSNQQFVFSSDNQGEITQDKKLYNLVDGNTSVQYKGEEYLVSHYSSDYMDWTFLTITNKKDLNKDILKLRKIALVMVFIFLIIALYVSLSFFYSIKKPIAQLRKFALDMDAGLFDTRIYIDSYTEFNQLADTYNNMIIRLNEVLNKNYILTIKRQEAELKALRAQINPHFLYNTLNSINSYAQLNNIPQIYDMTYALSDMLRYSISNNEHMVTISDEITHIKNYFVIQNIRFNNEIDISYDISPDVLYKKTIRFVLQPIAENSIYHGFDNVQKDKRIKITAQTKDGHTFLQIEDNGKGITESTLKGLKKQLFSLDESNQFFHCKGINSKSNIGIHNVHHRIRLTFGKPYGLEIGSLYGYGTVVTIHMP